MANNEPREDWPFGPFLSAAIQRSGLSKRAIASAAGISEGRLRQLETGYQKAGGLRVPIATSVLTVVNLSDVLNFDAHEGLRLAGLGHAITELHSGEERESWERQFEPKLNPRLAPFSVQQLLDEIAERFHDLRIQQAKREGRPIEVISFTPEDELRPATFRAVDADRYQDAAMEQGPGGTPPGQSEESTT